MLDEHPGLLRYVTDEPSDNSTTCSKDLGGKKKVKTLEPWPCVYMQTMWAHRLLVNMHEHVALSHNLLSSCD